MIYRIPVLIYAAIYRIPDLKSPYIPYTQKPWPTLIKKKERERETNDYRCCTVLLVLNIYTSEIKMKKIYIFKHNPNPNLNLPPFPIPLALGRLR